MNTSQLRELTVEDLQKQLLQKTTDLFKIRMRCKAGVEQKTHVLKQFRKEIARIKTMLTEKGA